MLMFLTSVGVGGLFLIALEYIAGAVWSTPFRRVIEIITGIVILLPVIAVPVYLNLHDLFHWTHEEVVQGDYSLESKSGYLNVSFFTIRVVVFFALWILFYLLLRKNSLSQDVTGDQLLTKKNIRLSAVFMPVFAVTITFSSIDWIMSLEPHWFSTIFGVYYFSGTVLAALAAGTLAIIMLNEKGYLTKGLVKDHYYSLGALLFAFTNFWAYIAFSQFLLIWYANLPEETFWFLQKWEGSWMIISVGLIFVHFIVPYFGLLSQPSKMDPKRLKLMSIWILFAHWYDLYWLVMPTFSKEEAVFGWMEVAFPILTVGIVILAFVIISRKKNLIPVGDPKLKRGLDFRL
ncbi:MAG: quinol:cytochrome C oxidoreductase [Melioribacteraceae bacterium]|nr:quinol:cytochrome C oxidoreductase [Melioribacteraceae bacterium]